MLLSIFGADSTRLGRTASLTVPGGRWSQANDIFATCGAPEADIAYATVEVVTGGGRVWAYASVVDNVTGDPTTVPVQVGRTVTLTVPAGRWLQQDDILGSAGAGERALAYAVVEPASAGARVWACASVIDATTGDPTTIPVLPRGSAYITHSD